MAINNFKAFGIGSGANVLSQSDYEALSSLVVGFQSGKASSSQVNKAIRQATVMASILAQFISDSSGKDVLDDGNTKTILDNLSLAIKNKNAESFLQIGKYLSEISAAGTTAMGSARSNLGLKTAALRDVGEGSGQIPDMSSFSIQGSVNVFSSIVIAGNRRLMEGNGSGTFSNGFLSFTLPLSYPSTGFTFIPTDVGSGVVSYAATPASGGVVNIWGKDAAGNNLTGFYGFKYIAMGSAK